MIERITKLAITQGSNECYEKAEKDEINMGCNDIPPEER